MKLGLLGGKLFHFLNWSEVVYSQCLWDMESGGETLICLCVRERENKRRSCFFVFELFKVEIP